MTKASELLQLAARHRDLAERAKRLAGSVSNADSDRLRIYAEELEEQAAGLEKRAAALGPPANED